MKKTILAAIMAIATATAAVAQSNTQALIPYPNSIEQCNSGKSFAINSKTEITTTLAGDAFVIGELQNILQKRFGVVPRVGNGKQSPSL